MGRGGDNEGVKFGCCCCVTIISVIMFACSFATLNPHEMGLHYNGVTFHVEETTYDNGRYFLGLGHGFHVYPRKLQYVEFSNSEEGGLRNQPISVWSKDGQSIILEVGFYFKLLPERLADLYFLYKDNYIHVIEDVAMNVLRDEATNHDTIDFFIDRAVINDAMHSKLNDRLQETVFATVPRFNLLRLDMPDRFEEAVEAKVVAQQRKNILEFRQSTAVIREQIEVIQAEAARDISVIMAASSYNGTLITKAAEAAAFERKTKVLADLRKELADSLGFNTANNGETVDYGKILKYTYASLLRGQGDSQPRLMVNVDELKVNVYADGSSA